ncbi:hypothetical protein IE983_05195 [Enterobacter hormaechei]|uniref:Uncharacterized protein n=1 Tax=Enterobacter hormaechei TaxID=158836 RepID=A0A927DGM2_9ENTR|nr:hypothetical protein [Enterobacter hormaechei]
MTNQHPAYMDGPAALRTLYAEAERRDSDADRLRAFSTPKTQPITTSLSGKVNTLAGHIPAAAARGEIEDSTSGWRDLPNRPETPEQIRLGEDHAVHLSDGDDGQGGGQKAEQLAGADGWHGFP